MLIDHTNYQSYLKESTQGRTGTPDGNVYFDTTNNSIQLIDVSELATFDHTGMGGGANDPNRLTNVDGDLLRALYLFESARRSANETLRKFKRGIGGAYRFSGAYNFINGVTLSSTVLGDGTTDRHKIRRSGWIEYSAAGDGMTTINRVYHGINSLRTIVAGSVPYYTFVANKLEATLQAATWTAFKRTGEIDEAIQVFGTTANGDTGAGNFDYRTSILVIRVRTWGYKPDEAASDASKITEFAGFKAGYGIGEEAQTENTYNLADVYGGAKISPWTGMSLEKLASPQTEGGFLEADGNFTWVLHNTLNGTVSQCAAFLDALSLQDSDIDSGTGTYNGRKSRVWYTRDEEGRVLTSSVEGVGLFIEGLPLSDRQEIVFMDNAGGTKHYPYYPAVNITVGAAAKADTHAWYHVYYVDGAGGLDFDTSSAVTVNDADGNPVSGVCSGADANNIISFTYDYDGNTQAGLTAGTDKLMVVIVESYGANSVGQEITYFTLTRSQSIPVQCAPALDNNA